MTEQSPPPPIPTDRDPPGSGGGYVPTAYDYGEHPSRRPPPAPPAPSGRRGGIVGTIMAAAVFLGKYGFAVFKFGKIGGTALSMLLSLGIYTIFYGWKFAAGFVLLILVHEIGHMVFAAMEGLPVTMPLFLGPFGAAISMKRAPEDQRQEAVVALGGPVFGTLGAAGLFFLGLEAGSFDTGGLLFALSFSGFMLNLFNLLPINPLDGGRIANAVTRWANVVGLVIIGLILLLLVETGRTANPFLLIILLIGAYSTYRRFRDSAHGDGTPPIAAGTRAVIGLVYLGMLGFAAMGMAIAGEHGVQNLGAGGQVSSAPATVPEPRLHA
jgi:Zn-dependent protease